MLVRTIALFELTFLTAGPDSQTLVVALYYAVFAAGVRAPQSVDAMAMVYMLVTLAWLLDRAPLRQSDAARLPRQRASAASRCEPMTRESPSRSAGIARCRSRQEADTQTMASHRAYKGAEQ